MTARTGDERTLGGRYRLGAKLGRGAMAEVYDGVDTRLERSVAIKVLRGDSVLGGPEGRARFAMEARAAARLSHPHSVGIYDTGTDGDVAYIVMERLPGTTMADYMQGGPLPAEWVLRIAGDVLDALGAAHAAGLTHRDIKPGNILITPDDRAKVADFGIAKVMDAEGDLTATGLVVGTAAYLPPERIDGRPATPQGDLYSLGVVLYEALAGRKPFTGDSPIAVAYAARHGQPPDLGRLRPDLAPALLAAVATAMAPDPEARFSSAAAMADALRTAAAGPVAAAAPTTKLDTTSSGEPTARLAGAAGPAPTRSRPRRRRGVLLGVLAAVLLVAAVAVLASRPGRHAAVSSPPTTAPPATATTVPATTVPPTTATPTTVAPTTAAPATAATAATTPADPQAAALESAAAALAGSGGAGSQAAGILQQVATLPAALRPAAATAAEAVLRGLRDAGGLTDQQYQQALAPLQAVAGNGPGSEGGPAAGGGPAHKGHGGHGGG